MKKFLVGVACVACVAFLGGCDAPESDIAVASATVDTSKTQESITALYLPGGAGLDFGKQPISDKVVEDKTGSIRILSYEFSESPENMDSAIASILQSEGYVRRVNPADRGELSVIYHKQGANPLLARYVVQVREGFDKRGVITLSWRF